MKHLYNPQTIHMLQQSTRTGSYDLFKQYTQMVDEEGEKINLRGQLEFNYPKKSVPIEGVSVVLVNSEKGKAFFEKIKEQAIVLEVKPEEILPFQGNLVHPTRRPKLRDTFYQGINENGYIEKLKTGLQLSERIKALLPKKVTIFLKGKLK